MSAFDYKSRCTCKDGICKGDHCLFCGAFDDPCPQTGAAGPIGRWEPASHPNERMEDANE